MAAKQEKKNVQTITPLLHLDVTEELRPPPCVPGAEGKGGAWTSPRVAVTGTQTSTGREGADKPSHGAGTFFPDEQARILLQFHSINADTTWSQDFRTHTARPHLSERGQKRADRESGPSPSPASEATPTSYPWRPRGSRSPPPPATTRALPTGVSAGANRGPWPSAGSNEAARLPCDVQTNRLKQQAQRGPRRTTEHAAVHISTENHS